MMTWYLRGGIWRHSHCTWCKIRVACRWHLASSNDHMGDRRWYRTAQSSRFSSLPSIESQHNQQTRNRHTHLVPRILGDHGVGTIIIRLSIGDGIGYRAESWRSRRSSNTSSAVRHRSGWAGRRSASVTSAEARKWSVDRRVFTWGRSWMPKVRPISLMVQCWH
jgi:hypothetical protein